MNPQSNEVRLHVWGDYACFTRPEMKVERVSYDVMTPSAARGMLEAVLWKPAIRWEVTRIDVLRPIRWTSVRRNEVGAVASTRNVVSAMQSGRGMLGLYVENERQQRAGLFLRDVAYVIHARFHLTERAGREDNPAKFAEMFRRRAERGQCFNQPYLGCREFSAFFAPLPPGVPAPEPIPDSPDLGWMLHDLEYANGSAVPRFFRAKLENGVLRVPSMTAEEVRA
ncbi:MAG: type I-C CRISPR-associated protein Cas5 [Gemmatimonadetes bacterium]|nr:type I-C CRISPR-associated protein Cas5 [Gemmatimonadota bacterium]